MPVCIIIVIHMSRKEFHKLVIEKLVPGGFGLGRLTEGIIVLVRYVLPGEEVLVREVARRKDFISAELLEVLAPSPDRITPPCPIYGDCGGCDLQHLTALAQIHLKKNILIENLQRAAGHIFSPFGIPVTSPLASPEQFGYRQRIRLHVDRKGRFGFFRPESHVIEPVIECLLAKDQLNQVLRVLDGNENFKGLAPYSKGFELLFNPDENNSVMQLHFTRRPRPADCQYAAALANSMKKIATVLLQIDGYGLYDPMQRLVINTPPLLSQTISLGENRPKLKISWEAGAFSQVNLNQNKNLISIVLQMLASGRHDKVLDLYCGYGNFSLPAAGIAEKVLGIDGQNGAIRSARRNAAGAGVSNCDFVKQQVAAAVQSLLDDRQSFDTIILDPPRQGAPEIIGLLAALNAEQIIYISCNPATLARDIAALHQYNFTLSSLVPIDMFPQTHHLESIALLKRTVV
jgi:23S rRNA (uracil1939-C5)-methyltransferase